MGSRTASSCGRLIDHVANGFAGSQSRRFLYLRFGNPQAVADDPVVRLGNGAHVDVVNLRGYSGSPLSRKAQKFLHIACWSLATLIGLPLIEIESQY